MKEEGEEMGDIADDCDEGEMLLLALHERGECGELGYACPYCEEESALLKETCHE